LAPDRYEDAMYRMCVDEYESYALYSALARSPMVSSRLREALAKAAEDEYRHYTMWRNAVGDCRSGVSPIRLFLYRIVLYLFGLTVLLKILESKEVQAEEMYRAISEARPDLKELASRMLEDETRHEEEFVNSIDEGRVKYIGSITLGISDALVELTGIYAGSLGAFDNTLSAGMTGLLAGIAASISMGIASYTQAKHEGRLKPRLSAMYTMLAYLAVVVLLALPYFLTGSVYTAFGVMMAVALLVIAYMSFYVVALQGGRYLREFASSALMILGVSFLLYILGSVLGSVLGVNVAG